MRIRPIRWIQRFFNDFLLQPLLLFVNAISPSRLIRRAGLRTNQAVNTVAAVTVTRSSNRPRRKWSHLLLGIPAILIAIGGISFTIRATANQRDLGQRYWRQALVAIGSKDYRAAQLYLMRAADAGDVDSREVDFALAVVYGELGYAGRAMEVFLKLAPVNRSGFPKAHRHLAILISSDRSSVRDNATLNAWHWHLTHADQTESPAVQESFGNYYLAVDDIPSAISSFSKAAASYPQLYLVVANLHARLGNTEFRAATLQQSKLRFAEKVTQDPYDRDSRVVYATTLLALGNLSEAEQVLRTGMRLDPEGPYQSLLAATFVQLHDKLMAMGPETHAEALQQLRNAFEFDANFAPAMSRLLGYAEIDQTAIAEFESMMNEILASGRGTALAHLALSNLAWLKKDTDKTTFHLEQAIALDATMPVIANNLAWMLAHGDPPELDRALNIAQAVIEDFPDNPRFLDTRGTILIKMGRNKEGLVDLEKALPLMPDAKSIHEKIAAAYEGLGMESLAELHRRKANPDRI